MESESANGADRLVAAGVTLASDAVTVEVTEALARAGNCLERSLIGYRYLSAAGATPSLVLGICHDDGQLRGHVWLCLGSRPLAESEAIDESTPLLAFGAGGVQEEPAESGSRPDAASASRSVGARLS